MFNDLSNRSTFFWVTRYIKNINNFYIFFYFPYLIMWVLNPKKVLKSKLDKMRIVITSKDDIRFLTLKAFENLMDASRATGLSDTAIRTSRGLKTSVRKKSNGFVYLLKWKDSRIFKTPNL